MMFVLIGLGGLTVLLLLIILGLLASLGSTVNAMEESSLLRDGIAATLDEGRMHAMLTAGAAFATKVGGINWEMDHRRDRQLPDDFEIDDDAQDDIEDVCEKAADAMVPTGIQLTALCPVADPPAALVARVPELYRMRFRSVS